MLKWQNMPYISGQLKSSCLGSLGWDQNDVQNLSAKSVPTRTKNNLVLINQPMILALTLKIQLSTFNIHGEDWLGNF